MPPNNSRLSPMQCSRFSRRIRQSELAPRRPRHHAEAREELIQWLARYQDIIGPPITIFFHGAGAPSGTATALSTPELEVLYPRAGQTADDLIERATHRFGEYGEVLAVTDDQAERETVIRLTGLDPSISTLIQTVWSTTSDATSLLSLPHTPRPPR